MKYQKTFRDIQREKAKDRLKKNLKFVFGILVFLIILGVVGALAR